MLTLMLTAGAVEPIQITVTDPSVKEVILECDGGKTLRAPVRAGSVSFSESPGTCSVSFLSQIGSLDGPAEYTCGTQGCSKVDVVHRDIAAAEGRVVIIITDDSTTLLELRCPSGYRNRARVETNTAVFDGVPSEDCQMFWKGGTTPAKAFKIRPGRLYCRVIGSTGVCQPK